MKILTCKPLPINFPAFYDKYMKPIGDQINASFALRYTPLAKTHFAQGLGAELPTGNMAYIYIFFCSCIFHPSPGHYKLYEHGHRQVCKQGREVGMRKVVGAYRNQLVAQFLSESVFMAVIALIIALCVVFILPS